MAEDEFDAENFPEELYLIAFTDVRMAVVAGSFSSGFQHYQAYGREEIERGIRHSPFTGGPPGLDRSVLPPADADPVPASPSPMALPASDAALPYLQPPGAGGAAASERFSEDLYLALNPDVAVMVAGGAYPSGRAHWEAVGAEEERGGLRPSIVEDSLYTDAVPPGTGCEVETGNFDAESYFLLYPDVTAPPWVATRKPRATTGSITAGSRAGSAPASRPIASGRRARPRCWPSRSASTSSARLPPPAAWARRPAACCAPCKAWASPPSCTRSTSAAAPRASRSPSARAHPPSAAT